MEQARDPRLLLQRVLLLEKEQGFRDRAAIGGLAAFTRTQIERAGEQPGHPLQHVVDLFDEYPRLDVAERETRVSQALEALIFSADSTSHAGTSPAAGTPDPADSGPTERPLAPKRARSARKPARAPLRVVRKRSDLQTPIRSLKGMRKVMADGLEKVGVTTVEDALHYFPRAHYDYTDTRSIKRLRLGEKTTLVGRIDSVRNNRTGRGAMITTAVVSDESGTVAVRWFNQPFLRDKLPVGARIAVSGEPDIHNGFITFAPRDFELIESSELMHTGRLVPMYPLTKGLYQRSLRAFLRSVLDEYLEAVEDHLPEELLNDYDLVDLPDAIGQFHFPEDENAKADAQRRLAFDELLLIQLGLLIRKREWQRETPGVAISIDAELAAKFRQSLPFSLTGAQDRVVTEVFADLSSSKPMSRLVQGDVGSGKTVVAAAALLQMVKSGKQAVMMAPTEVLAEQHFRTLSQLMAPFDVEVHLLIGSTPKSERKLLHEKARGRLPCVLVGTHALIQEDVDIPNLGLAITDEQHRFGVEQRALLRRKGELPHVLAMTATPIPRTLAIAVYGDLDLSAVDEMPAGRVPTVTQRVQRPVDAYRVIQQEVAKGHQAFVICPVIEESLDRDMRSVMAEYRELSEFVFPNLSVGLLHGRMKPAEKEEALQRFRNGEFHVLVATSVVEVGIDVPNATVMVIRDAHRFGLAQLHQFRGRVGRGGDQAYCVLLSDSDRDEARERLEAVTATEDGFELAEVDLQLRGPGEFWGTRQAGLPELRVARLTDVPTIQLAREVAVEILREDPVLARPKYALLRGRIDAFWEGNVELS